MSLLSRRALAPALLCALVTLAPGAVPAVAAPSPLSAQPGALDFGVVPAEWGEQTSSIWIQNDGPDDVQPAPATIDGSYAYRVGGDACAGQTLTSGQGCNITVGFDPGDGSVHDATLHVPVAGFDDLELPLSGTGGVQQVTLEPQALAFGTVAVGDGTTRSFTLTSTGTLPFESFVALPTGGDVGAFHVERDGCSLQHLVTGQPCTVGVRFAPLAEGVATATLLLIGGASEPAVVPLHGTGAPAAAAAPAPAPPASPPQAAVAPASARTAADVVFDTPTGLPAPFAHGRIDLGRVRCASSERCVVTVRPRVFAIAADGVTVRSARSDVVLWRLPGGAAHATLVVPAGLRGRPALLVARLRTRASGHSVGRRLYVVPLVAGHRVGATRTLRRG